MFGGVYSSNNEEESQTGTKKNNTMRILYNIALDHYKMRHESLLGIAFTWKKITSSFESTYRILHSTKHFIKKKNSDRKIKLKRFGQRILQFGKENLSYLQIVPKIMRVIFNTKYFKSVLDKCRVHLPVKMETHW